MQFLEEITCKLYIPYWSAPFDTRYPLVITSLQGKLSTFGVRMCTLRCQGIYIRKECNLVISWKTSCLCQ